MFYEDVMEQMFENGRLAVDAPEKRESVMEKLMQTGEKLAAILVNPKSLNNRGHGYEKRKMG